MPELELGTMVEVRCFDGGGHGHGHSDGLGVGSDDCVKLPLVIWKMGFISFIMLEFELGTMVEGPW